MILLRMFSKKEKNKDRDSKAAGTIGIIGAGIGVSELGKHTIKHNVSKLDKSFLEDFKSSKLKKENKRLLDSLIREAEGQGTNVETIERAGYINPKTKKEVVEDPRLRSRHSSYNVRRDEIVSGDRADVFAHELGHSKHFKGRDGSRLGKIAHRLHGNHLPMIPLGIATGFSTGVASGMAEDDDNIRKSVKRLNTATGYLPAALTLTGLGAEIAATKRGLKALKSHGASKEYLEMAKKSLKQARNTYVGSSVLSLGSTVASRAAGKAVGRKIAKKEKESKEKK